MGYLAAVAHGVVAVVRDNRGWMAWNLILAIIPAGFAAWLFPHRDQRTWGWWAGVAAFAAFLPNAPYVLTDLIHIGSDIDGAKSHSVILAGVLPLYAVFITIGYLAYIASIELAVREVHTVRPTFPRWATVGIIHAACSAGIVLGRVSRLNSWDTITSPRSTLERTFATLAWRGALDAWVAVFVAVSVTYWVVRTLAVGTLRGAAVLGRLLGYGPEPA